MSKSKRTMAVAIAALAVAGGGGAAIAASQGSSASPEAFFDSLAERLGISTEELEDAAKAAAKDQVDAALEEGRITEEEAERLRERIEEGESPFLFGPTLFGGLHFFGGPEHGGAILGAKLEAAAEYLGLTQAQLRDRLDEGQSLADVARAEDKSVEGLERAILADAEQRLNEAVEDGDLTREQANEKLQALRDRIDDFVERDFQDLGLPKLDLHLHGGPAVGTDFDAAAGYLGLTRAELRDRLEEGQSLADIARAEDKSVEGLEQALIDEAERRLNEAVEEGELTRERANEMLDHLREGVDDLVEGDFHFDGPRPRDFGPPPDGLLVPGWNA